MTQRGTAPACADLQSVARPTACRHLPAQGLQVNSAAALHNVSSHAGQQGSTAGHPQTCLHWTPSSACRPRQTVTAPGAGRVEGQGWRGRLRCRASHLQAARSVLLGSAPLGGGQHLGSVLQRLQHVVQPVRCLRIPRPQHSAKHSPATGQSSLGSAASVAAHEPCIPRAGHHP